MSDINFLPISADIPILSEHLIYVSIIIYSSAQTTVWWD